MEAFKVKNRHKEFLKNIVSFCLHIDRMTICQVFVETANML